ALFLMNSSEWHSPQRLCKPLPKDIRACNSRRGTGEGEGSGNSARPQNLEPSHADKIVRQLLTFVKKFGLEHPELKQYGEQEEPLFMGRIVKENLPLSTHRRPYVRFSEEARGPSGQSQLQPAQMRIDCPLESDYSPSPRFRDRREKDRSDLVLLLSDSSTSLFSGDVPLGILPVASIGIGASRFIPANRFSGHCDPCRADQK